MSKIISPELNKKIRKEYTLRFFTLLFFFISSSIIISIIFVSSSYLILSMYEKTYLEPVSSKKLEEISVNNEFTKKLSALHMLSQKVIFDTNIPLLVTQKLFEYASGVVEINSFEIKPDVSTAKITLRGVSPTRDALIQFENRIKQDASFTDFSIPIDTFAKQKDISFAVTFAYHEK